MNVEFAILISWLWVVKACPHLSPPSLLYPCPPPPPPREAPLFLPEGRAISTASSSQSHSHRRALRWWSPLTRCVSIASVVGCSTPLAWSAGCKLCPPIKLPLALSLGAVLTVRRAYQSGHFVRGGARKHIPYPMIYCYFLYYCLYLSYYYSFLLLVCKS